MSQPTNEVVTAKCPGCSNSLRIPANWVGQSMRCKHCGLVFQAKASSSEKSGGERIKKHKKRGLVKRTILALNNKVKRKLRRRKKKRDKTVPTARPHSPPAAIPLGPALAGQAPPAAIPVGAIKGGALPAALPVNGKTAPVARLAGAPSDAKMFGNLPATSPRRRRSGTQKFIFAVLFFTLMGMGGAVLYSVATSPNSSSTEVASLTPDSSKDTAAKDTGAGKDTGAKASGTRPTLPKVGDPVVKDTKDTKDTKGKVDGPRPTLPKGPETGSKPTGLIGTAPRPTGSIAMPAQGNFPRRLLAVIPVNYAYANPISSGGNGPRNLNTIIRELGQLIRVPENQIFVLSDKAPESRPPIKSIIELNVSAFLKSSKPQERVVLMFAGHGVEAGDKAYLVPLDGETNDPEKLISLDWLYKELEACPARQKVLMIDVCRFDPGRGEERGAVAKMGEAFDKALLNPPDGVQVLTACTAGQYSYEVEAKGGGNAAIAGDVEGGIMLNQIPDIKFKGGIKGIIQRPEEPIPMKELTTTLFARTKAMAQIFLKSEQTPRLSGTEAEVKLVYDAKAAQPGPFQLQLGDVFAKGVATRGEIEALFKDTAGIPPVKKNDKNSAIDFDSLPPFPKDVLAAYKDEGADSPLREKVREAMQILRDNNAIFQDAFDANFDVNNQQQSTNFKNGIGQIQMNAGLIQFKLDTVLEELTALKPDREKENKRWKANYDYVCARLAARIAYVYEYNAQLGQMRKEYPERDPAIHKGWRLASQVKLSDRDADKYEKTAKKFLETLAKENASSPWALLAKREQLTSLGLKWTPNPR